jgi:hypothetical protein
MKVALNNINTNFQLSVNMGLMLEYFLGNVTRFKFKHNSEA